MPGFVLGLYVFGTFLAIFASAGLDTEHSRTRPHRAAAFQTDGPHHLLLGRYFGNLLIVALNTVYMVTGVWLIIAYKTDHLGLSFSARHPGHDFHLCRAAVRGGVCRRYFRKRGAGGHGGRRAQPHQRPSRAAPIHDQAAGFGMVAPTVDGPVLDRS